MGSAQQTLYATPQTRTTTEPKPQQTLARIHPPDWFEIAYSDAGNARRLLAAYGSDIVFHTDENIWYVWDGKVWAPDPESLAVHHRMKITLQEMRNEAQSVMKELEPENAKIDRKNPTEDEQKILNRYDHATADFKWVRKSESDRNIAAAVRQACSEAACYYVSSTTLDAKPMLFNLQNGTLDLNTIQMHPHLREDYLTRISPVTFDAAASCPRFERFLREVFPKYPAVVSYLQRVFGYCLTGLTTERIVIFLIGLGANGKSVLCNVLLRGIFGLGRDGYGCEPMFSTFTFGRYPEPDKPRNDLVGLHGRRFISAGESDNPSVKMDTALLKSISGNDVLTARANFSQQKTYQPQGKIFLRTNTEPRIIDSTESIWQRVKRIPFEETFTSTAQDENLTDTLLGEASGILNWMLAGYREVKSAWDAKRPALQEPEEVKLATAQYRHEQSQVARFFFENYRIAEREVDPIPSSDIFTAYVRWAEIQHEHPQTQTNFGRELNRLLVSHPTVEKREHGHRKVVSWFGIEIKNHEGAGQFAGHFENDESPF